MWKPLCPSGSAARLCAETPHWPCLTLFNIPRPLILSHALLLSPLSVSLFLFLSASPSLSLSLCVPAHLFSLRHFSFLLFLQFQTRLLSRTVEMIFSIEGHVLFAWSLWFFSRVLDCDWSGGVDWFSRAAALTAVQVLISVRSFLQ